MTITHDSPQRRRRSVILLTLILLGAAVEFTAILVFVVRTSPHLIVDQDFLALETEAGSISAQWPDGSFSIWLWNEQHEWRLWPPGLPRRDRH